MPDHQEIPGAAADAHSLAGVRATAVAQTELFVTEQANVRRWQLLIPATTLGRVRLGAMVLACISLTTQLGELQPTGSHVWDVLARLSLAGLAVGFLTTYVRGRTWVVDPIVLPLFVAVAGSALRDPIATIGLTMILLLVQALYGSLRSWAVRSFFGMLSLPAALIAAPTPIGALMDLGRSAQLIPQILLVTALTRAIYAALGRQEQAAAREALLAQAGNEMLAATQVATVHRIALDAGQRLATLSPGIALLVLTEDESGLRVEAAAGAGVEGLHAQVLPAAVLTDPAEVLSRIAPRILSWNVEQLATRSYRLVGGVRPVPEPVINAFRTLGTQVRLAEDSLRSHAELDRQANHDSLTHLPTRAKFFRELITAVDNGAPSSVAMLNIDLDDFKKVNDGYGHAAGDELLVQVARRIEEVGGNNGIAGRMGGDEFVLLLTGVADAAGTVKMAETLCDRLVEPMRLSEATVRVGASIGVAINELGTKASELTRRADIAMYSAKARGKNRVSLFTVEEHGEVARHRLLEDQLPYAIERDEIEVFYQPYLDLTTGKWAGVEALVQWGHPSMGPVNCRELLALAERTGELTAVTAFFLRRVAADIGNIPGGSKLQLGMNLSAHQLFDPQFAEAVLGTLAECKLAPSRLALEIVESEQIDDARARAQLDVLSASGVRIALDDFGTGYVSLASLRAFPIDQLKINGSFLTGAPETLDLMLSVGALLGTETLVQGVTTEEELERLRDTKATAVQGPLIAPIMPAAELAALLAEGTPAIYRNVVRHG
ncbi:bifunctional diguanylate cyclase/phosphodiesterase [Actinoplanes sp. TFC3]|uniref:putative bifunctional diguanylate cyclase/phosphodiesterase n=1 Tax=Actinoplanes sp. TFC3 TaxID=1710355 RepID=UPI00082E2B61|nr:EAL domain-containing protein [Actinoplanes sp. TFC3]